MSADSLKYFVRSTVILLYCVLLAEMSKAHNRLFIQMRPTKLAFSFSPNVWVVKRLDITEVKKLLLESQNCFASVSLQKGGRLLGSECKYWWAFCSIKTFQSRSIFFSCFENVFLALIKRARKKFLFSNRSEKLKTMEERYMERWNSFGLITCSLACYS